MTLLHAREGQFEEEYVTGLASRWRTSKGAQVATFVLMDIVVIWISTILAFFLRFQGSIPDIFVSIIVPTAFTASLLFPAIFALMGLYGYLWRYVGVDALVKVLLGMIIGTTILGVIDLFLASPPYGRPVPFGTLALLGFFAFAGCAGLRSYGRLATYVQASQSSRNAKRVAIIGAGDAASLLMRDIENKQYLGYRVVVFIDDDESKRGRTLRTAKVRGPIDDVENICADEGIEEVFVAMPSATTGEMRRVLYLCGQAGLTTRVVPSLADKSKDNIGFFDLQQVGLEHFLEREPVDLDMQAIRSTIEGKVVAVTGAAGSIGSELCRQVAALGPERIVMMEIDESRLYETWIEVSEIAPGAAWMSLCDIRSLGKVQRVFEEQRPELVIHAAAYKHVPLMQIEPDEAVKANVMGTQNVINACEAAGVGHLVLISTDKAVRPKSVMGTTKYLAERMLFNTGIEGLGTTAVRFGNVLGSRGSVVPIFEQQLRRGESLNITHPDVTRYFMTIAEAVQLVLQAQAMSEGRDLYVLDMGEPVKIVDLAQALIEMGGGHAEVEFAGLRTAEKMHETLADDSEGLSASDVEKIMKATRVPEVAPGFHDHIELLTKAALADDRKEMDRLFAVVCPDCPSSGIIEGAHGRL